MTEVSGKSEAGEQRILIGETDDDVRSLLARTLREQGYEVSEARHGGEILELAREGFDLFILDRLLPEVDGIECLRRLKADPQTAPVPVLFVTASDDEKSQVDALDAGAADYVTKPFYRSVMLARVRLQLRLKAQEDRLRKETEVAEERTVAIAVDNAELGQLVQRNEQVLDRLGDPQQGYIAELRQGVETLRASGAASEQIEQIERVARQIEDLYQPYQARPRSGAALRDRSVLVVETDRALRKLTMRAVVATGARVHAVGSAEECLEHLRRVPTECMFLDWANAAVIKQALEINPMLQTVMLTSQPVFVDAGKDVMNMPLSSVVITNVLARPEMHDPMTVREIVTTTGKLLSGDIFGLEKYLGWGTAVHQTTVTSSEQDREDAVQQIADFAGACGLRKKIVRQLETLADELLMNAIWDAPADAEGHSRYNDRDRSQPLHLSAGEEVTIRWGSDGNFLAVSVLDNFGGLEHEKAFNYLLRCFAQQKDQISWDAGGAGLGLYMAYNMVNSFIINVAPGERTEVIGLLNLHRISPEDLDIKRSRSFCYFRARDLAGAAKGETR